MKQVTKQEWYKMLITNCNKNKHRFRTNDLGITFCIICGLLSNKGGFDKSNFENILIK